MSREQPRTRIRRLPDKAMQDLGVLHAVLDAAQVAHVAVVDRDQPYVLPMACARDRDDLLLHGSRASRLMTTLASGAPACATVTLLDGLVYARSAFESSMHYRSATILGRAAPVPADGVLDALRVLTEHLLPGRWTELLSPTRKELAATLIVALPLSEWSLKVSDGPPEDPASDLAAPVWAGVLPLHLTAGAPVDAPDLAADRPVPRYVTTHLSPPHTDHGESKTPSGS
ncbi:MAG: pyridoxamine 5'-phosphate oxidase family protein [Nocardioidaceae bacterium]